LGTVRKTAKNGSTQVQVPFDNQGTLEALQGTLSFYDGLATTGGSMLFGLGDANEFGRISIQGTANFNGSLGVVWLGSPAIQSFNILDYGAFQGAFAGFNLPQADQWQTNYSPTSFSLSATAISTMQFVTQPIGAGVGAILPTVTVRLLGPNGNPTSLASVPVTLSIGSGTGVLYGTLRQDTDTNGLASFNDLVISAAGTKVLEASAQGYVAVNSAAFPITAGTPTQLEIQITHGQFLLQLTGLTGQGPIIIQASTDLRRWTPILTNSPAFGITQFIDESASNYPYRFYRTITPLQ
jgi:hypothetical protein